LSPILIYNLEKIITQRDITLLSFDMYLQTPTYTIITSPFSKALVQFAC